jgi:hypothetical protein
MSVCKKGQVPDYLRDDSRWVIPRQPLYKRLLRRIERWLEKAATRITCLLRGHEYHTLDCEVVDDESLMSGKAVYVLSYLCHRCHRVKHGPRRFLL